MFSSEKIKVFVNSLEEDCKDTLLPPEGGLDAVGHPILPFTLVRGTRGYLERLVHQINGTYINGWYDACAVMIRRLIETLIIEVYECHNLTQNIKSPSGDFLYLSDLISNILKESAWTLGNPNPA